MNDRDALIDLIHKAFGQVPYPGDDNLRGSDEGTEPFRVESEFRGKVDWSALSADFIDQAPGGLGSSLSFFSDEAFRFYIAAYLLADIDGRLERADPIFHLTYGLNDESSTELVNPRRYGNTTWFEVAQRRFRNFDAAQREAVAAYLTYRRLHGNLFDSESEKIEAAIRSYWRRGAA